MKRLLIALVLAGLAACASTLIRPAGLILYAQSLPAAKHAQWTPNPANQNVTNYVVTVNGTTQNFPPASCAAICSAPISLAAFGNQTVTVAAQNLALSTDPTSTQTGPATTVSFTLSQAPTVAVGATVTN